MMLEGGGTTVVANDAHWRGPGHNAVLQDDGRTWLVYHALDPAGKPSLTLRIDTVRWTADGWPEVDKPAPPVTGWWERSVAGKAASTIHLLPDGRIDGPGGSATWTLSGNTLEMRWPDPRAPGGAFVDRCSVAANGRSYAGHNQLAVRIEGRLSVIGWWEHRVAEGAATMIRLLPGGRINNTDGPATWTQAGDTLELRWPSPAAPGGAWIDTLRLSADRGAYDGHNQNGIRISGWQVASE